MVRADFLHRSSRPVILSRSTVQIDLRRQGASPATEIMAGKRPARRLFCSVRVRFLCRSLCSKQQSL